MCVCPKDQRKKDVSTWQGFIVHFCVSQTQCSRIFVRVFVRVFSHTTMRDAPGFLVLQHTQPVSCWLELLGVCVWGTRWIKTIWTLQTELPAQGSWWNSGICAQANTTSSSLQQEEQRKSDSLQAKAKQYRSFPSIHLAALLFFNTVHGCLITPRPWLLENHGRFAFGGIWRDQ